MKGDENDPKGLIHEAYRIEGISAAECRSIFLDWAMSLPADRAPRTALDHLIATYGDAHPGHPMNAVLSEGRVGLATPRRRGGWRARPRD